MKFAKAISFWKSLHLIDKVIKRVKQIIPGTKRTTKAMPQAHELAANFNPERVDMPSSVHFFGLETFSGNPPIKERPFKQTIMRLKSDVSEK